jgi:hypothetical protein
MEFYLGVLAGCVINLLFGLNDIFGKPEFSWKVFFKQNLFPTILNLICGAVLVWRKDDIANILPITALTAVFIGSTGQLIFKKLSKMFNDKVETYVGINK